MPALGSPHAGDDEQTDTAMAGWLEMFWQWSEFGCERKNSSYATEQLKYAALACGRPSGVTVAMEQTVLLLRIENALCRTRSSDSCRSTRAPLASLHRISVN